MRTKRLNTYLNAERLIQLYTQTIADYKLGLQNLNEQATEMEDSIGCFDYVRQHTVIQINHFQLLINEQWQIIKNIEQSVKIDMQLPGVNLVAILNAIGVNPTDYLAHYAKPVHPFVRLIKSIFSF